ncbi:LytTR family transcriptional regulator [Mobilisporobacter senegalensis]|uniref:LytTR family transcriptional regulator n=1 Tax=Mobilisporobacter senegalensis TaxID=1329262 RepID=A0A3N1XTK0_9FIRM|nr:LytTR family DNA-binding domain-containing protein [Mobilisporobacter senegalensis]ROR28492.1 LytTR family transcriptional regulator [Mobilisporobacter senegalensis]
MKITIETIEKEQEEEILIRCHEMTDEILTYVNSLKISGSRLIGYDGNDIHCLSFEDVYYFEAVDNKVFIYCENKIYESRQKLYELEQLCENRRFFRCSKSTILNIEKIKIIHPSFSGRFEVVLDNQEIVIVSRKYVPQLKSKLGLGG